MARKIRGRNEGSITQRSNGTWRAQLSMNGKRISFGAKTKAECQEWLRRTQHQIDYGLNIQGGKIKTGEYLKEWLENATPGLRPKTAHQYSDILEKHIIPYIGRVILKDLTQQRIERFYSELTRDGRGARTVLYAHQVLHKALEKAVLYGLLVRNPAHGATLPRQHKEEMKVWDEAQVASFLAAASGSRLAGLYHLAVVTGMREGELFGLKWSDIQWSAGVISVQRQVQRVPHKGWSFIEPKTKAGRRTIRIGPGVIDALRQHKVRQQLEKQYAGGRWVDYDLIFPNSVGNPLEPSNMRLDYNRLLEEAGLPKIRFHDLRHTAASLMLNHGVPVIVVSNMLGHSKPSVTLDIYAHLYHESQSEAARLMDDLVTPVRVEIPKKAKTAPPAETRELHQSAP